MTINLLHYRRVYFGTAFLLLAAGVLGYYGYHRFQSERSVRFDALVVQTRALTNQNQCVQAVQLGQQAADAAPTPPDVLVADYALGIALACRGQGNDIQDAFKLFKTVAADRSADPALRADAYNRLGGVFFDILSLHVGTMQNFVFDTAPFSEYLAQANGDVMRATLALFSASIQASPTAFAYYERAAINSISLHQQGLNPRNVEQQQTALSMQRDIDAGDALIRAHNLPTTAVNQLWQLYLPRAIALGAASYYRSDIASSTVDAAYEQTIAALNAADLSSRVMKERLLALQFSYAAILSARSGTLKATIKKQLEDYTFKVGEFPLVDAATRSVLHRPADDVTLRQLPALSAASPNFAAYLKALESNG